jgi:GDSL/SGNH-like Acyl-Esterase family found in Pmr5 and Cas1p
MKGGRNLFEWVQLSHLPDIVVMNIAAHLHDIGDMMDIVRRLGPILDSMRRMYTEARRPLSLAWRTSHSGHLDCADAIEPLKMPGNQPAAARDKHGWRFHQTFDAMAMNASRHLNYTMLDMSPLILRPDAHSGRRYMGDCLHYCIPGPIDIFSVVLQQALFNKEL